MKSSNKTAANIAFAAAAALMGSIATFQVDPTIDSSKAELLAPATVEVGALSIFNAQGTNVQWEIHPDIPFQPFGGQDHTSLATSFQLPGKYLVICSWKDQEGGVQLRKTPVLVVPLEPTPAPEFIEDVDDGEVVSILEPSEPIEPVEPPAEPTKPPSEVHSEVVMICEETNASKEDCCKMAATFRTIAEKIEDGKYSSVAGILRDTSKLNRNIIVKANPTTTRIQVMVSAMRFNGEVESVSDYAPLWDQIARGLSTYGECT